MDILQKINVFEFKRRCFILSGIKLQLISIKLSKEILATFNLSVPKEISYFNQIKYFCDNKYTLA